MSPERKSAIAYLAEQVQRYREELRIWLRAPQGLRSAAQNRLIAPLQDLVEDATRLLSRLRGKSVSGDGHQLDSQEKPAPAQNQEG